MEKDIVERLRAWNGTPFDDDAAEAADEIERLRAAMLLTADRAMGRESIS